MKFFDINPKIHCEFLPDNNNNNKQTKTAEKKQKERKESKRTKELTSCLGNLTIYDFLKENSQGRKKSDPDLPFHNFLIEKEEGGEEVKVCWWERGGRRE